jgi:Methyltransferase domain
MLALVITLAILVVVLTITNISSFKSLAKYRDRVKQKGFLGPWQIPSASLADIDPIFKTNEFGPTMNTMVQFMGRGDLAVPGGTSDTEAWILAVLAKKSQSIFEFGTCTGKTTFLMAKNSAPEAKVATITLAPEDLSAYKVDNQDDKQSTQDALNESVFTDFLYSNTPEETKIEQLFGDSKVFDESKHLNRYDLIFVDGSHAYSYVLSDSRKALKMLKPGGLLLWHDYSGPYGLKDVYNGLNEIAKEYPLVHIKGTTLVAYRKPSDS